jgi:Uma2 family endonuclease
MSTAETKTWYTPQDLLTMPDGDRDELVDGNLVEKGSGFRSSLIRGELQRLLGNYSHDHLPGWVLPRGASYQCFPENPDKVRKLDVSFIRLERLPVSQEPAGPCPIAPDLAVEVVGPQDLFYAVAGKVKEFLNAGVSMVWVVDPATRKVHVHRADRPGTILREHDHLSEESVLPGFRCKVAEIFQPPAPPA